MLLFRRGVYCCVSVRDQPFRNTKGKVKCFTTRSDRWLGDGSQRGSLLVLAVTYVFGPSLLLCCDCKMVGMVGRRGGGGTCY